MAKAELNELITALRGRLGNLVFRQVGGQTILSRAPDFGDHEPTDAQVEAHNRFRQATLYGKAVMADPEAAAAYKKAAAESGAIPLFSLITRDYLRRPTVDDIDLSNYTGTKGDEITVTARDDFEVVEVHVLLIDAGSDTILDEGKAELQVDGRWIFRAETDIAAGTSVVIRAVAIDRPGGEGEMEVETTL